MMRGKVGAGYYELPEDYLNRLIILEYERQVRRAETQHCQACDYEFTGPNDCPMCGSAAFA